MAIIDENSEYAALAYDGTDAVPLKIDPVTGRLLVEIHYLPEAARTIHSAKIDENSESTAIADGEDGETYSLHIDARNDYLLIETE